MSCRESVSTVHSFFSEVTKGVFRVPDPFRLRAKIFCNVLHLLKELGVIVLQTNLVLNLLFLVFGIV